MTILACNLILYWLQQTDFFQKHFSDSEISRLDVYVHNPCTGNPRPALGDSETCKLYLA